MTLRPLRVACCATAESGHMNPVMSIAEAVAKRGHEVKVITFAYGAEKYEKKIQKMGAKFVGLPCELNEKEMFQKSRENGELPFVLMHEQMKTPLAAELRQWKPDVVVTDFMNLAPMGLAEELDVPLIINVPGPMQGVKGMCNIPDFENPFYFMGVLISYTPMNVLSFLETMHFRGFHKILPVIRKHVPRSILAVNSFIGLERPTLFPPWVTLTGPLQDDPNPGELARTHPELNAFLESSARVIYITTGSMVSMPDWMIVVMFNALKRVDCTVVWSLKQELQQFLPSQKDPAFFVSSWLPQPALLCHDKVVAVVTHCGWGGILECIAGGKPILPLPFFADQLPNATMLVEAGMAVMLGPPPPMSHDDSGLTCYKVGSLNEEQVAKSIEKMLGDSSYQATAMKMKAFSKETDGASGLAVRIEQAGRNGVKHLHNETIERKVEAGGPTAFKLLPICLLLCVAGIAKWAHGCW